MKIPIQWLLCFLFLSVIRVVSAQSVSKELSPGYYVVVGAYAPTREDIAKNFVEILNGRGEHANYGFNKSRNLYFVYLKYFNNLKESLKNMEAVRASGKFVDAWVRVVPGSIKFETLSDSQKKAIEDKNIAPKDVTRYGMLQGNNAAGKTDTVSSVVVTDNGPINQYPLMLTNTEVFLSLYNARNNRIVDGEVVVVDTERARRMAKVSGNEYLTLPDPKSKSGQLTLISESFGYRKIQQEVNYPLPLADTAKSYIDLVGTTIVVNFDLVRYHRGDIATLYNVYFYNDASIMMSESKYELNSLLEMMQENPKYRIRLHGHTNGNYRGKIITMGPEKDFFMLKGATESIGTAKELSRQRAQIIKDYLVANGIDPLRVEVKAWGGKRPLYDKKSVNSQKNVRVEVEILAEE